MYGTGCYSSRRPHPNGLARQATFSEEIARTQNRQDRFFADPIDHGKLYTAVLQVHHVLGCLALRVDNLRLFHLFDLSCHAGGVEKSFSIKRKLCSWRALGISTVRARHYLVTPFREGL